MTPASSTTWRRREGVCGSCGMREERKERTRDITTAITAVGDWPTLHRLLTESATSR